jgi:hypothetical protein
MRDGSPNPFSPGNRTVILSKAKDLCTRWQRHRSRRGSEFKSLFQNILDVSPCGSRFYLYPTRSPHHKPLRMNILGEREEKNREPWRPIILVVRVVSCMSDRDHAVSASLSIQTTCGSGFRFRECY